MTALAEPMASLALFEMHLPPKVSVLSGIRERFRGFLDRCCVDEGVAFWAVLVAEELVANAIVHGKPLPEGSVAVSLTLRGLALEVSAYDADPTPPSPRISGDFDENGRGLLLVDELAVDWGSERLLNGKRVWAQLYAGS